VGGRLPSVQTVSSPYVLHSITLQGVEQGRGANLVSQICSFSVCVLPTPETPQCYQAWLKSSGRPSFSSSERSHHHTVRVPPLLANCPEDQGGLHSAGVVTLGSLCVRSPVGCWASLYRTVILLVLSLSLSHTRTHTHTHMLYSIKHTHTQTSNTHTHTHNQ
jgi:hypothetical protein